MSSWKKNQNNFSDDEDEMGGADYGQCNLVFQANTDNRGSALDNTVRQKNQQNYNSTHDMLMSSTNNNNADSISNNNNHLGHQDDAFMMKFYDDDDEEEGDQAQGGNNNNNNNNEKSSANERQGASSQNVRNIMNIRNEFGASEAFVGSRCGPLFHDLWQKRNEPLKNFSIAYMATKEKLEKLRKEFIEQEILKEQKQKNNTHSSSFSMGTNNNSQKNSTIPQKWHEKLDIICYYAKRLDRLSRLVNIDRALREENEMFDVVLPLPVLGGGGGGTSMLPSKEQKQEPQKKEGNNDNKTNQAFEASMQLDEILKQYENSKRNNNNNNNNNNMMMMMPANNSANHNDNQSQDQQRHYKPHQANGVRFLWETLIIPLQQQQMQQQQQHSSSASNSGDTPQSINNNNNNNSNVEKIQSTGAIVAQSMGLGKTLQTLTFIHLMLKHVKNDAKILVVVPRSVIISWMGELEEWRGDLPALRNANIFDLSQETCIQTGVFSSVTAFRNNNNNPDQAQQDESEGSQNVIQKWLRTGGVAFASYEKIRALFGAFKKALIEEQQQQAGFMLNPRNTANNVDDAAADSKNNNNNNNKQPKSKKSQAAIAAAALHEKLAKESALALFRTVLDLVVCDEAHRLRNQTTLEFEAIKKLLSKRRLALTGTPLQNRLLDYYSMIDFALPGYFDRRRFISFFQQPIDASVRRDADEATKAKASKRMFTLMKEIERFVQRVDSSELQRQLPPITEIVFTVPFSQKQMALYEEFRLHVLRTGGVGSGGGNAGVFRFYSASTRIGIHPLMHRGVLLNLHDNDNDDDGSGNNNNNNLAAGSRRQRTVNENNNSSKNQQQGGDNDDDDNANMNMMMMMGPNNTNHVKRDPRSEMAIELDLDDQDDFDDVKELLNHDNNHHHHHHHDGTKNKNDKAPKPKPQKGAASSNKKNGSNNNKNNRMIPALSQQDEENLFHYDKSKWSPAIRGEIAKNTFFADSPRLNLFLQLLRRTIQNGECALVFSHSTKILDLVESALDVLSETPKANNNTNRQQQQTNNNNNNNSAGVWGIKEFSQRVRIDGSTALKTRMDAVSGFQKNKNLNNKNSDAALQEDDDKKKGGKTKRAVAAKKANNKPSPKPKPKPKAKGKLSAKNNKIKNAKHDDGDDDDEELIPGDDDDDSSTSSSSESCGDDDHKPEEELVSASSASAPSSSSSSSSSSSDDEETQLEMDVVQSQIHNNAQRIHDESPRIFLLSTKAGGVGLTLHRASRVFLLDNGWNPADERQAIARAYRFGQTRPVFVYRFVAFGTFENKIFETKLAKEWLFSTVVDAESIDRNYLSGFNTRNVLQSGVVPPPWWSSVPAASKEETVNCMSVDQNVLGKVMFDLCKLHLKPSTNNNNNNNNNTKRLEIDTEVLGVQRVVLEAKRWQSLLAVVEQDLYGEEEQQYYETFLQNGGLGSDLISEQTGEDGYNGSPFGDGGNRVNNLRDVHQRVQETKRGSSILGEVIRNALEKRNVQVGSTGTSNSNSNTSFVKSQFGAVRSVLGMTLLENGRFILAGALAPQRQQQSTTSNNTSSATARGQFLDPIDALQKRRVFNPSSKNVLHLHLAENNNNINNAPNSQLKKNKNNNDGRPPEVICLEDDDDDVVVKEKHNDNENNTQPRQQLQQQQRVARDAAAHQHQNRSEDDVIDLVSDDDDDDRDGGNHSALPQQIVAPVLQPQPQQRQAYNASWVTSNADAALAQLKDGNANNNSASYYDDEEDYLNED